MPWTSTRTNTRARPGTRSRRDREPEEHAMAIDHETTDVFVGGYLSTEAAHQDYDAVRNCGAHLWGAVVVSKDLEGNVTLEQTDHVVAEGAAGLTGVGFVVGLFAPPLLAATAIGAAIGGAGGKALRKKIGSQ